ncbi:lipid II flippase MurJ [Aminomonas paucivorans]|uniref:lipid II flippase MurJ n=1 Tax=Aminomonas paucivorans TaxID=81412 RepID=UPI000A077868|nr:lipid II flippase MurJ [Aminomonas paucivorans]
MEGDLSGPSLPERLRNGIHRILGVKEARSATLVLTFLTLAGKPFNYLRILLVASFFGASLEMDVFNVAFGIMWLFAGTAGSAMENAVLPLLAHKRETEGETSAKKTMALAWWILILYSMFLFFTILASSEQIIKLFASGFDQNRLSIGRSMLFWLLPYTISTILKSGFDIWAQHSGKYSLSAFASSFSGLLSLIAFLATYSWLGVFSIPFSFSFSWFIVSLLTKLGVRDFPFCLADFDRNSVFEILKPTLLSLIFLGTGALYGMTDRYFASLLPIGSITTISYADFIFGAVSIITTPSLLLFLSKSSRLAANASSTNDYTSFYSSVTQALVIVLFLFFPLGIVLSGVSISLVDIVIGHGAFSFDSVILTGNCLAAYALAMPASLGCVVFFRIAQAQKKLVGLAFVSLQLVCVNALGDWALSRAFGAPGIAAATSIVYSVGFLLYGHWLLPGWWRHVGMGALAKQCALTALWAGALGWLDRVAFFGSWTPWIVAPLAGIGTILHFLLVERLGWLDALPRGWKPTELLELVLSRLRRRPSEE